MNNIKDYREKELKNYVIGNVLFFLVFSGKIRKRIVSGCLPNKTGILARDARHASILL